MAMRKEVPRLIIKSHFIQAFFLNKNRVYRVCYRRILIFHRRPKFYLENISRLQSVTCEISVADDDGIVNGIIKYRASIKLKT